MTALVRLSDRTVSLLAWLGALGVLVMMGHVFADVLLRGLFDAPIPATVEIVSRYYMVLIAFLPLAWVERRNGMVSVEIVDALLPRPLLRLSDIGVALLASVLYAGLAYTTGQAALSNFATGTFVLALNIPLPVWPTYFLPPLGFGLAACATLIRVAESIMGVTPHPAREAVRDS